MHRPLRLTIDRSALQANWRWLQDRAGVPAGAAIKADGYGLGARETMRALHEAGCREFFVSTWAEAEELGAVPDGFEPDRPARRRVRRHRCRARDQGSPGASTRWSRWRAGRKIAPGSACDVMIDTGMNRLGLRADEIGVLDGLSIDTLHSHLACADEDHPHEPDAARALPRGGGGDSGASATASPTPPGSASAATIASTSFARALRSTAAFPGARRRAISARWRASRRRSSSAARSAAGETCGYGATFTAEADTEAAILNIGYADGYLRGFSSRGSAFAGEYALPVLGRVSMDLIAVGCDAATELKEGDWVELDYDLPSASKQSGLSQYELLTTLGSRFERVWR